MTVITAVHNGERFLSAAIESILSQTFDEFEYILVDDASTDSSPQILARYAAQDGRLRILHNADNRNVSNALNGALSVARGEYIAILDQDDLACPQRLAQQAAFLDGHPQIGVVGAQACLIDQESRLLRPLQFSTLPAVARWAVLFGTPVLHSAAMLRRELMLSAGAYDAKLWFALDYNLVAKIMLHAEVANLPATLAMYRRHEGQASHRFQRAQLGQVWLLIHSLLVERLQLRAPLDAVAALYRAQRTHLADEDELVAAAGLLSQIYSRFLEVEDADPQAREQIAADCASRYLVMAWLHRRLHHETSRTIYRRALTVDPKLWLRPSNRERLRRMWRQPQSATYKPGADQL